MALPTRRHSSSRRDLRRTNKKLTAVNLSTCPQCHEKKLPHRVCPACGYYAGQEEMKIEL
ncbi:MAG: 50S ribosomal protein L32 [bacterium]